MSNIYVHGYDSITNKLNTFKSDGDAFNLISTIGPIIGFNAYTIYTNNDIKYLLLNNAGFTNVYMWLDGWIDLDIGNDEGDLINIISKPNVGTQINTIVKQTANDVIVNKNTPAIDGITIISTIPVSESTVDIKLHSLNNNKTILSIASSTSIKLYDVDVVNNTTTLIQTISGLTNPANVTTAIFNNDSSYTTHLCFSQVGIFPGIEVYKYSDTNNIFEYLHSISLTTTISSINFISDNSNFKSYLIISDAVSVNLLNFDFQTETFVFSPIYQTLLQSSPVSNTHVFSDTWNQLSVITNNEIITYKLGILTGSTKIYRHSTVKLINPLTNTTIQVLN